MELIDIITDTPHNIIVFGGVSRSASTVEPELRNLFASGVSVDNGIEGGVNDEDMLFIPSTSSAIAQPTNPSDVSNLVDDYANALLINKVC